MRNWLTRSFRAAEELRERRACRALYAEHRPEHQVAAAELYLYRLRHWGASIDDVAAELDVSSHTLRAWVDAYWK